MGGGSWPRGGKKRKTRPDIARRRERQRDWESSNRTRKRRTCEAHPSASPTSGRNPCTDARRTETTCVTPTCVAPRHVDASCVFFFSPNEQRARGGGGGGAASLFFFFFFPCSADHERDWPPCKVVFFSGWQPINALNVRNNKCTVQWWASPRHYTVDPMLYLHRGACLNAMKRFCICSL